MSQRSARGWRIAIVAAQFHEHLVEPLVRGALETLLAAGVRERDIATLRVPGSFELPTVAMALARARTADAIICLGVLIRGETPHFDYIATEAARGIAEVGRSTGVPAIFGVVTAESIEQAVDRAGGEHGNRGAEAAQAALAMAEVMARLRVSQRPSRAVRRSPQRVGR